MKTDEEGEKKEHTWLPTNVQNLYRHKGGPYYGRFKIAGKKKWVALKTTVFTTAKLRLADEGKKIAELRAAGVTADAANLIFASLIKTYLERVDGDSSMSVKTKQGRHDGVNRVLKTWPRFESLSPTRLAPSAIANWSHRLRTAAEFSRPGAETVHRGFSADPFNKAVDTIIRLLDIAVEKGTIPTIAFAADRRPNVAEFASQKPATIRLQNRLIQAALRRPTKALVGTIFAPSLAPEPPPGGAGSRARNCPRPTPNRRTAAPL